MEPQQPIKIELYDRSGIACPHCGNELPKSLFVQYLKSNFIRYFVFSFALAFTLLTVISDIRAHYANSQGPVTPLNPYPFALAISGIVSLLGWLGQKRGAMKNHIIEKRGNKENG